MSPAAPAPIPLFPPVEPAFYNRPTLDVAASLLGKLLIRAEPDDTCTAGIIQEVEAYIGQGDLGCHARAGRTARNDAMWGPPGRAYVYFTYGMHWMLNVVTEAEEMPAAVLLRAVLPLSGIERMRARCKHKPDRLLCDGPAKLCQAFAIDRSFNHSSLCDPASLLTIRPGCSIDRTRIQRTARIGLENVPEPWKSMPWRLYIPADGLLLEKTGK
ncbi:MAG: DNA-3-methyladenine glycosylase [Anaerolineales bacterium]|nr:DNA-3-methyladenine glycosylase [Anaerolineales bacterium]